jgi:hypothetical protein
MQKTINARLTKILALKCEGNFDIDDLGLDGMTVLTSIANNWGVSVWTEFVWFRAGFGGGLLLTGQ